jgi:dsRNA-specific ribonuclease
MSNSGNAARRMIAQLKEHGLHQPDNHRQPDNHEVNRHPVTELQEYLHQRHIAAPAYQYIPHDGGYEHLKEFTCKCTIDELGLQVKERRKNQKIARTAAATQMLKDLLKLEITEKRQNAHRIVAGS